MHRLLETCSYVRCQLIDFSKAFDTVDVGNLAYKLIGLDMPSLMRQWIFFFLTGTTQSVCDVTQTQHTSSLHPKRQQRKCNVLIIRRYGQ